MEKCNACRGVSCEQTPEGLEITDKLTNIIEVRPTESINQCGIRERMVRKSNIIYEKGTNSHR